MDSVYIQVTYVGKDGGTYVRYIKAGPVMGREYAITELKEIPTTLGKTMGGAHRQAAPAAH